MAETRENRASDLLNLFNSSYDSDLISESIDEAEVELTLGLSLNGRFGVDPRVGTMKLTRTSSIPEHMYPSTPADYSTSTKKMFPVVGSGSLMRTSSLPVEPEEEVRKRKEMQSLRRMEAKRKRIEKQRNLSLRSADGDRECVDRKRAVVPIPVKIDKRVSSSKKGLCSEKLRNLLQGQILSSQGSASESESQVIEGVSTSGAEVRSTKENGKMEPEITKEEALVRTTSLGTGIKNQFTKLTVSDTDSNNNETKETFVRNGMMDMPCVSTQGDGPDGKRIEGLLYRYNQNEEIRIVCICHGKFLSPAEFVKHAGGTDVVQPLKHIVVTPSAFL